MSSPVGPAVGISYRLLGPVEVWRDGVRLDLGGRMQRALLASLLVRAGRVVSQDQLVDDLWGDDPPARAVATLQVFVSNLRRALEPDRARGAAPELLVTAAPGYVLHAADGSVDALEFVRLAEAGRDALADDDPEEAARLCADALARWRGPALADVADLPFAAGEAARLADLRRSCLADRVEADLRLGRHAALVAELEQRVAEYPLDESARAQLMLALYRCDRQADALATYAAGRRALSDELGLEPGMQLRNLQQAVLRQDPDLAWEPPEQMVREELQPTGDADVEPGRVLVVDDSRINRRLLVDALTRLGHEVHAAEHGRRALELLATESYDVVLLDLLMPVMDGYTTLAAIKADPALNHVPVIMVSAVHELESVVRCIDLGAVDYLPKPFSAAVLRARLRSSLAAKRLRDVERGHLRRYQQLSAEVDAREAALREEIAALRAKLSEVRSAVGQ